MRAATERDYKIKTGIEEKRVDNRQKAQRRAGVPSTALHAVGWSIHISVCAEAPVCLYY
jgi:hypothetical protein